MAAKRQCAEFREKESQAMAAKRQCAEFREMEAQAKANVNVLSSERRNLKLWPLNVSVLSSEINGDSEAQAMAAKCQCAEFRDSEAQAKATKVLGVDDITKRVLCIKCRSTVDQIDGVIGICSRCSLSQRTDRCPRELVARLLIGSEVEEFEARTLTAFERSIKNITEDDTIDGDTSAAMTVTTALLKSRTFNCTYSGNVIKTVAGHSN